MNEKRNIVAERNEKKKAYREQDNQLRAGGVSHAEIYRKNSIFAGIDLSSAFKNGRFVL